MNLLFFQIGLHPNEGGVQRVSFSIAKGLSQLGHKCYCIYSVSPKMPLEDSPFVESLQINTAKGQDWDLVEKFVSAHHIDFIVNQCGTDLAVTKRLHAVAQSGATKTVNCIHISPTASREVLGYRDCRIFKHVVRSLLKEILLKIYPIDKIKQRKLFKLADCMVLLSERCKDDYLTNIQSNDEDKIRFIHNPASYGKLDRVPDVNNKERRIIVVARMGDAVKRIFHALDVWRMIQNELPDWSFDILGDGPDLNAYKKFASDAKLERITFHGMVSPEKYYERAAIFLMTSSTEGFGMTLVEAQQFGCVPIAMDSYKALHDIIENGVNGIIVPRNDTGAMASAVVRLATDNAYREQLALSAMESVKKFDIKNIAMQWDRLFHEQR